MTRLFVEQLTVIDCAFLDAQRGLVGESWIVDVELEGDLDHQSMVLDFSEVKKRLKRVIDDTADHKLLVPRLHAGLWLHHADTSVSLQFKGPPAGAIEHHSPTDAICLLETSQVNEQSLVAHLQPIIAAQVPANVAAARVILRNEDIRGAYYHYAHGLKKHTGHCQRIAHGHRSRLQIAVDGQRDEALERAWADSWRDIYLGTQEDVVSSTTERMRFEYSSVDGTFELELPASRCTLLDTDSTVERIAGHIARRIAAEKPGHAIEIRAYEGVMKGAVARA